MEETTKLRVTGSVEQLTRFEEILEDLSNEKRIKVVNASGVFANRREYIEINVLKKKETSKRDALEEMEEEDEKNVPFHLLLLCELSSYNLLQTEKNELMKAMRFEEWSTSFNQLCGIALYKQWEAEDLMNYIENIFPEKIGEKRYEKTRNECN